MKRLMTSATALLMISGCETNGTDHVDASYFGANTFERHQIAVAAKQEYLEIDLNPRDSQLRLTEIAKIKAFVATYKSKGHGPLIMSIPNTGETEALGVRAAAEARQLAWERGIDYQEIQGMAYNAEGMKRAPMIMAFTSYDAIKPECQSLGEVDFADAKSNNDMPTLGCAVRQNMAAMIADPADLFGDRPITEGDIDRRAAQLQLFRQGAITGAERSDDESAQIASAVN